jgi:hypothetical protein
VKIQYQDGIIELIPDSLLEVDAKVVLNPSLWPFRYVAEYLGDYSLLSDYITEYVEQAEGNPLEIGKLSFQDYTALKRKISTGDYSQFANGTCLQMVVEIAQTIANLNTFTKQFEAALTPDTVDINEKVVDTTWQQNFGDFNTLMSLSDGDLTKFDAILATDTQTVYTTLAYKALYSKAERKYQADLKK